MSDPAEPPADLDLERRRKAVADALKQERRIAAVEADAGQTQTARGRGRRRVGGAPATDGGEGGFPFVMPWPADAPIEPIGFSERTNHFLTPEGLLVSLQAREMVRLELDHLIPAEWSIRNGYARLDATGRVTGIHYERVVWSLNAACREKGYIDLAEMVRGRGAWAGTDGKLYVNCGDVVLVGPAPNAPDEVAELRPGRIDGFIYLGAAPLPRPVRRRIAKQVSPAKALLRLLETWPWARKVDARLLLGWIGAAMICGALPWRPWVWISGPRGSGKSTIHRLQVALMGKWLVATSDASAAGIWQRLRQQPLPVALDEAEPEEGSRRLRDIVNYARSHSTGSTVMRGGADHQGSQFVSQSCFLFSSINRPSLRSQDLSRLAILELGALPRDQAAPQLDQAKLRDFGAMLFARMIDGWSRFHATFETFRARLAEVGHSARGCDQFGTLLACAHLLLHDEDVGDCDDVDMQAIIDALKAGTLTEMIDDVGDETAMLQHLLSTPHQPGPHADRASIGEWVARAAAPSQTLLDGDGAAPLPHDAMRALELLGLKIHTRDARRWLFIATMHPELMRIFKDTQWAGRSGAVGAWTQSARRLPGALVLPGTVYLRSMGGTVRGTLVPLELVVGAERQGGAE